MSRSAAVLGHPVDHSLSPILHGAAYRALGLDDWIYERIDCDAESLPGVVRKSPPDRIGYSVTMPGKFAALEHADEVSERARIVGSANTLVRSANGWYADCTDIDGVTGALAAFGDLPSSPTAVVLGAGGTARPVLAGLAEAGARGVILASRRDNAGPAAQCGRALGLEIRTLLLTDESLPSEIERADVLHDVGRSINPALDRGQVEGAFVQGTGWLTSEELRWDKEGRLRTHAPSTYKIPLASDRPKVFNVKLAEWSENKERTIKRSKAVGEPPFMLGISVFEAIGHAVASVADYRECPRLDAPATPERVLMAVERLRGGPLVLTGG